MESIQTLQVGPGGLAKRLDMGVREREILDNSEFFSLCVLCFLFCFVLVTLRRIELPFTEKSKPSEELGLALNNKCLVLEMLVFLMGLLTLKTPH